jgi:hypothetical protein
MNGAVMMPTNINSSALVDVALTFFGILVLLVGPIRAFYQIRINLKESGIPQVEIGKDKVARISRAYPVFRMLKELSAALFLVGTAALVLAIAVPWIEKILANAT